MSQALLNTVIKDGMITAAKVSGPILITMLGNAPAGTAA